MKKLFLILVLCLMWIGSAFAKAGDIKIISSSNDFIRIKLSIGTFYISESKYWEAFEKLAQEANFYCKNNNKIAPAGYKWRSTGSRYNLVHFGWQEKI